MCWELNKSNIKKKEDILSIVEENTPCYKFINLDNTPYYSKVYLSFTEKVFKYKKGTLYLENNLVVSYSEYFLDEIYTINIGFHSYSNNLDGYGGLSKCFKQRKFIIPKGAQLSILDHDKTQVSDKIIYPFPKWLQFIRKKLGLNPLYNNTVDLRD
jgi:hypothetical protein